MKRIVSLCSAYLLALLVMVAAYAAVPATNTAATVAAARVDDGR